jgi:signal transduction histidine kinase/DNA-binding response OmpR family regulator
MLDQAAQFLPQVVFVLVAVLTAAEWAHTRSARSRDAALMFGTLAVVILLQWFSTLSTVQSVWLTDVGAVAVLAQPYLLIRLVGHARRVPRAASLLALAGMVGTWVIALAVPAPMPLALTMVVIVYFAVAETYAGVALVFGAIAERGAARRRLTYAALGSCLLAAAIVVAGLNTAAPSSAPLATPISRALAILCALAYYMGFAPPSWIRDVWRGLRLGGQVAALVLVATTVTAVGTAGAVALQLGQTWSAQLSATQTGLARLAGETVAQHLLAVRADVVQAAAGSELRGAVEQEPWDLSRVQPALDDLAEGNAVLGTALLLDLNGVMRASTLPDKSSLGLDLSDREYFRGVVRTRAPYISSPYRPIPIAAPIVGVGAPVFGRDGQMRAVLVTTIDLVRLTQALQLPGAVAGTRVVAVAPSGAIAVHPDPGELLQPAARETGRAAAALAGETGVVTEPASSAEPERLVAYGPVPETGWAVLVSTPTATLFGPIMAGVLRAGALAVGLIVVLAAASALLAVRLFWPLRSLTAAAARFGAGDYSVRVEPAGPTDVRALGVQFNGMASAVAEQAAMLEEKNRALEEASRLKSEFLANMSHELRTPLNAIIGFSELLIDSPSPMDEGDRLYLETIHKSGQHLLALINDVLDLAKVEAGKMELQIERFSVAQAVRQALATVEPLAGRKAIELVADFPDVEVAADSGKFRQILLNLLSNAIKFTPEGGRVSVDAASGPEGVRLTVADTGIGIAPEDHERIFGEFQQVDGGANRRYEGTGLGLALVRRFAELHGGRVWVESAVGKGSRFHVLFPAAAPSSPVKGPAAPVVEPAAIAPAGGPLVLVVEDDPISARLLAIYLARGGYRTEIARDGREALEKARKLRPAAITLDVLLPELDGWEVLQALKSDEQTRDVPVVVVSVVDDRPLGDALGAVDYLVKPIDRQRLLAALERHRPPAADPIRVLAVDDDPAALDLVEGLLAPTGCRFLRAGGGQAGIELAREELPDIVLLDLMMPGVTGFDVLEALGDDPTTRDIPVVVVTAKDLTDAEKAYLKGRVAAVIQKGTLSRAELLDWLRRVIPRAAALREPALA